MRKKKFNHTDINFTGETQTFQVKVCTGSEITYVSRKSYKNPAKAKIKFWDTE